MRLASEAGRLEHDVLACLLEVHVNCNGSSLIELEERDWLVGLQWSGVLHPFGFPLIVFLGGEFVERLGHLE